MVTVKFYLIIFKGGQYYEEHVKESAGLRMKREDEMRKEK